MQCPTALCLELTMEDSHSADTLVSRVTQETGRLDLLVQNAVYQGPLNHRRLESLSADDLQAAWLASISSPVLIARAAFSWMRNQQREGAILMVGSGAGRYDPPAAVDSGGWSFVYGASKAALHRLCGVMDAETPDSGVFLVTVNPGVVDTPALRSTLGMNADLVQKMGAQKAEVVGEMIAWLACASPRATWHRQFVDLQKLAWKGWDQGLV
jgi:NAD(P)-dependent dehydrogenase (short-subunit alcohol dehydrogenase family)